VVSRLLDQTVAAIRVPDAEVARLTQAALDTKTKPRRSLGRLEDLACQIAAIRGLPAPPVPRPGIVVMAADHGVSDEGVSAYPAEVTAQMLVNFARGGAAINVLARQSGTRLLVVDMGTRAPAPNADGVVSRRIGPGTRNFTRGPAMTAAEAVQALETGIALAAGLADDGIDLVGLGEMGIGNTTAASALTAALLGLPAAEVTGRGTGIDDETWRRKVEAVRRALEVNRPDPADPLAVLAALGGFEIAGLAGVALGAAARRLPVLADGFIASVAALVAARLAPAVAGYVLAAHRSVEVGHRVVLAALGARPLLDLDLRLGEGTGAALAVPLIQAAVRLLHEMATFAAAGVSDTGH
jgi:nicotinate-nucleotide--dimethylbenzimidazole phosphoribosyltransferase